MSRDDNACGSTDTAELLDSHRVDLYGRACASVLLGNGDTHDAQLAHLLNSLNGEALLLIDLGSERLDLFLCKLSDHLQE